MAIATENTALDDRLAEEDIRGLGQLPRLLRYLKPYRNAIVLTVLVLGVMSACEIAAPYVVKLAVDGPMTQAGDSTAAMDALWMFAWIYLALTAAKFVLRYVQFHLVYGVGQKATHDLRVELFAHLQKQPMAFYDRHPVGRLVTRCTNDVEALSELFSFGVVTIFFDLLKIVAVAAVMFWLEWRVALAIFIVWPLIIWATVVFQRNARGIYRAIRLRLSRMNTFLNESITGVRIVQSFRGEKLLRQKYDDINGAYRDDALRMMTIYSIYQPAIELFSTVSIGVLIWFGGNQVTGGTLEIGTLLAFWMWTRHLYQPVRELAENFNVLQSALVSSERIFHILDAEPTIADAPEAKDAPRLNGAITLDDVTFSYRPGQPVLNNVSFDVSPGQMIAIVGATGSGKSTIIKLVSRLYDIDSGQLRIDGKPIKDYTLRSLRRQIGVVLQDVFLFSGSVAENVRLRETGIEQARILELADAIGARKFIERLPEGFATGVHERGQTLSAGERQLVAFLRALVFDPRILILDEATANIDTETEATIQEALNKLVAGRTSIVIAHRISTIQKADRILVMHQGQIAEAGSHAELIQHGGLYARLHALQFDAGE
jgi:ATP-binding cassette subfamily B protein